MCTRVLSRSQSRWWVYKLHTSCRPIILPIPPFCCCVFVFSVIPLLCPPLPSFPLPMDLESISFGKALWVCMNIKNNLGNKTIKVQNATVTWGKFFRDSKGTEISADEINGLTVAPGAVTAVSACRRPSSFAGTEGSIDLFDKSTRICTIVWDLPSKSKENRLEVQNSHNNYVVTLGPWESYGAIGHVSIDVQRA